MVETNKNGVKTLDDAKAAAEVVVEDIELLIKQKAEELKSDGCTAVTQLFKICCLEHDIYYRTHRDLKGNPLTRGEADVKFRQCMQSRSRIGKGSPIAIVRWLGVKLFAKRAWRKNDEPAVK